MDSRFAHCVGFLYINWTIPRFFCVTFRVHKSLVILVCNLHPGLGKCKSAHLENNSMTITKRILLALVVVLLSPIAANADPIRWTIEDLYFANDYEFRPPASDPTGDPILFINELVAVTGSFIYDADTNAVSDVDVSSPDGERAVGCTATACTPDSVAISDFFGSSYSAGNYNGTLDRLGLFDPVDLTQIMLLTFAGPLTNAGGTVDINNAFEYYCGAACPSFDFATMPFRTEVKLTGARVVGVAVPEPGTLTLLGIGLLGIGLNRRRKKA